jgi:TIR domain
MPAEIFLSHSSRDRQMASRIAAVLRGHGIPVFLSPENIVGAQQWQEEILKGLQ